MRYRLAVLKVCRPWQVSSRKDEVVNDYPSRVDMPAWISFTSIGKASVVSDSARSVGSLRRYPIVNKD